jgi:hypothetical protein
MNTKMMADWEELAAAAEHWFKLFDDNFAKNAVPLHERPVKSAILFLEHGIQEVTGVSMENPYDQEWFAAIVIAIRKWYMDRYGPAAFEPERNTLAGIVTLHGTPVRLEVPATVSQVEVEGESFWMIFADSVHESEEITSFFTSRPNLNVLEPSEMTDLERRVAEVVACNRTIHLGFMFASGLPDEARELLAGIWGHIDKAVSDILKLKSADAAVGSWELHLALEKLFKVYLQQNGQKPHGHDLHKLYDDAKPFGLEVPKALLDALPHWRKSNAYRYNEAAIEVADAVALYTTVLQVSRIVASSLKYEIGAKNAAFLLKKPKWVGRD